MAGTHRARISASPRLTGRKSALKTMRREGMIPGSLYGGDIAPSHIQVRSREMSTHLGAHGFGSLMDLDVGGQVTPVVLREVDRDGLSGDVIHVSFQRIAAGASIQASIPLRFEGMEELIDRGLVLQTLLDLVQLQGQADRLPESLTIDVRGHMAGDTLHIGSIALPAGVTLLKDAATAAAIVTQPRTPEALADQAAI
jgi:large subunit ribosomal protein L25